MPLIVVAGNGPTLVGRNWLEKIQIDWKSLKIQRIAKDTQTVENLIKKYEELFQPGVGTLKGYKAKLSLKQGSVPKFFKPRCVPHAMKTSIEKELDRLEAEGVLERISWNEYALPIVAVPKSDGSVRICGDYKVSINPSIYVDQYPLPKPEEMFAEIAGERNLRN